MSGDNISRVIGVHFDIFGNQEVLNSSVIDNEGITFPETYDNGEPKFSGVLDTRMGTSDQFTLCSTCKSNYLECPAHFGHLKLVTPMFHFGLMSHVKNVLSCIDLKNGKLLVSRDQIQQKVIARSNKARFAEIKALCSSVKTSPHSGTPVPTLKVEIKKNQGLMSIVAEYSLGVNDELDGFHGTSSETAISETKRKVAQTLTAADCYYILKNISDEDCEVLGISRPERMILTVFPIPPPAIRPSVRGDFTNQGYSEHATTHKLVDIIKFNMRLKKEMEKAISTNDNSKHLKDYQDCLQYHIATYFDNESMVLPRAELKSGGNAAKSITSRFKGGKIGRIRGNLQGKRVDYSARTVITSDPNNNLDELGVPLKIARTITYPEIVTPFNIVELTKLVRNGRMTYPGANFVENLNQLGPNGKPVKVDLKYKNKDIVLQYGQVVHRHLQDGDIVLFNRQPSLHKMSMMAHKVRVIQNPSYITFRLNVTATTPYNADFDGDEMNLFAPQSEQAKIELMMLADIKNYIISPKDSKPIVNLKQDALLGSYKFTSADNELTWKEAMNMLAYTTVAGDLIKGKRDIAKLKNYTGQEIFSYLIPKKVNINNGSTLISNGKIQSGILGKSELAGSKNSIVHLIIDSYDKQRAADFMDDVQRINNAWLMKVYGFSVGLGDAVMAPQLAEELYISGQKKIMEIYNLIEEVEKNHLIDRKTFEEVAFSELNSVMTFQAKTIMSKLDINNSFYVQIKSGSKGKDVNVGQMVGSVGQATFENKLIQKKLNGRTIPHYAKQDDSPSARGFILNPYVSGLTASEFFFHNMDGRTGIIDTAIKSVSRETEILVQEEGKTRVVEIGMWIDGMMASNKQVELDTTGGEHREELKLTQPVYIPTIDLDGKLSWGLVTAVTRHNPSAVIYKIRTHGGREVSVTDSHSLLVWSAESNSFQRLEPTKVRVGDFVPVTAELPASPQEITYIDLSKYLPESEYIHGTEFIKAKEMLGDVMDGRQRTPANWWSKNNGSTFTLPYSKVQLFLRTLWRFNVSFIQKNCIYPFGTNKKDSMIPTKFDFTKENGLFLGLYLAEGNSDIKSGYIQITNNDTVILDFIRKWFDDRKIKSKVHTKINKIGGTSTCIRGYSVLLAKVLKNMVGGCARSKHIPSECFAAPPEFLKELINGIISGDGTITENSIQLGSASVKLVQGVSTCLNRLGIFGKITVKSNNFNTKNMADIHLISVRAQWASLFQKQITLLSPSKEAKLRAMKATEIHRNFATKQNVVLDEIVAITAVASSESSLYDKVYDMTVPSTLNFGLANGLHVVDTADTGYMQRKTIKATEDVYLSYDSTVRNSSNGVVQFIYGDSGYDCAKQMQVKSQLIMMDNETVAKTYSFTDEEQKKFKVSAQLNDNFVDYVRKIRDELRDIQRKSTGNSKIIIDTFSVPFNLNRVISYHQNKDKGTSKEYNTPDEILATLDDLLLPVNTHLLAYSSKDSMKVENDRRHKLLLRILLIEYLAPRKVLVQYNLSKEAFAKVINELKSSFNMNIAQPCEMVGILAAQSIGEPLTQFTLNTFHSTGVSDVTSNMSSMVRFKELISFTKNIKNPFMKIYLKEEYKYNEEVAMELTNLIENTKLSDVVLGTEIWYENNYMDTESIFNKDQMNDNPKNIFFVNLASKSTSMKSLPWVIRFLINREVLLEKNITLLMIKTQFVKYWNTTYVDMKGFKKKDKEVINLINNICIMSNNDSDPQPVLHIRLDFNEYNYTQIIEVMNLILGGFKVKGVEGIEKAFCNKELEKVFDPATGKAVEKYEYVITTLGSNIQEIFYLEGVDSTRTVSNDVYASFLVWGIEATRALLIKEINTIFSGASQDVNFQHLSILVDIMLQNGNVTPVNRYGINKLDTDPMSRASFEKTIEQLIHAAVFQEKDKVSSVSSRIIAGRVINGGTGMMDILVDTARLEQTEFVEDKFLMEVSNIKTPMLMNDPLISDLLAR